MTRAEYADYEQRVAAFFTREGIDNLSQVEEEGTLSGPYFSWRHCECCHRPEGGCSFDCEGYNPTTEEVQGPYLICEDCYYYAEYGRLDDQTMQEMGM